MVEKRLLIVEDEPLIRELLIDCLSDAGFDVTAAESGDRAMVILEEMVELDLLITDIDMPGRFDGNAVAVRANMRYPGLPVIYASGRLERLTNEVGPHDAVLKKPFVLTQLVALATRLLAA